MQTSDTLGGFRKMECVKLECFLFLFENEWGKMCVCECDYVCVVWYTSFISTMMVWTYKWNTIGDYRYS